MDWYNYLGIVLGIVSLFFGFTTFFLYMKVRKLFSLLSEEQIKEAEPIILQQNKKIKIGLLITVISGILGIIGLII